MAEGRDMIELLQKLVVKQDETIRAISEMHRDFKESLLEQSGARAVNSAVMKERLADIPDSFRELTTQLRELEKSVTKVGRIILTVIPVLMGLVAVVLMLLK